MYIVNLSSNRMYLRRDKFSNSVKLFKFFLLKPITIIELKINIIHVFLVIEE
jgi:hypothetical protein